MVTKIKGENLMIFYKENAGYQSIGLATSHTLQISTSTSSESNKDEGGLWESQTVNSMNWSISTENLNCGTNFDTLFRLMTSGEPIQVVFGHKAENQRSLDNLPFWTPDEVGNHPCYLYKGEASISNLQLNAPSGENSTLTAEFSGIGELKQIVQGDEEEQPDDTNTGTTNSDTGTTNP